MRDDPVMVCELCGCGFLVNPGSKIHPTPIWFTSFSEAPGACLGNIRMAYRSTLIRNLDLWEISNVKDHPSSS